MKSKILLTLSLILNFFAIGYIAGTYNKYHMTEKHVDDDLQDHFIDIKSHYKEENIEAWKNMYTELQSEDFDADKFDKSIFELHQVQEARINSFTDYLCSRVKKMDYKARLKLADDLKYMRTKYHKHMKIKGE